MKKLLLLSTLAIALPACASSIIYQNISGDTGLTIAYSAGGYTEIGDLVNLAGTDRNVTSVSVQFYDLTGIGGIFDATLRILDTGFNQLATSTVTGLTAAAAPNSSVATFLFPGVTVPDDILVLVSVSNFGGLDLGLNLFQPPAIGSSLSTQFWVSDGVLIFAEPASDGEGNFYVEVAATGDVPEPSTLVLMLTAIPGLLSLRRRARTSR